MNNQPDPARTDGEIMQIGTPQQPTCSRCGKPMRFNVPRMGPDGGYVHADTGRLLCAGHPTLEGADSPAPIVQRAATHGRPDGAAQHYEPIHGELVQIGTDSETGLTRAIVKIDCAHLQSLKHVPMYRPVVITATADPSAAAPVSATVEQRHVALASLILRKTNGRVAMSATSTDKAAELLADFEARAVAEATAESARTDGAAQQSKTGGEILASNFAACDIISTRDIERVAKQINDYFRKAGDSTARSNSDQLPVTPRPESDPLDEAQAWKLVLCEGVPVIRIHHPETTGRRRTRHFEKLFGMLAPGFAREEGATP